MRNRKSKDLRWVFGLLFFLGLVLIYKDLTSVSTHKSTRPQFQSEDPKKLKLVNRHLKETALNLELERLKQKQEATNTLERFNNTEKQGSFQIEDNLSFDSDVNMQRLTDELNRSVELRDSDLTPEQIIHNELFNQQILDKQNRAYTEAYMKQFIENARAGGWEIKLGPNMEVISVKKIKPRRPSLINQ